jgi:uncharacterized protein (DUF2252 family)
VLQVKQAVDSQLAAFADSSDDRHHGERVVATQTAMQAASDPLLGWTQIDPHTYYVRQYRDMKGSIELEGVHPKELAAYSALCGAVLARAHARVGSATFINAYLGNSDLFDKAVAGFAMTYADQVDHDYRTFAARHKRGGLPTPTRERHAAGLPT